MLINREFQKLIREIDDESPVSFTYTGIPITMRLFDQKSKLSLSASVYEGGNYIPQSVRKCLSAKSPFASIKTSFNIDEERFQISIHYLGAFNQINDHKFQGLLEEFNGLVGEWRVRLDEKDRNDLIHVRVK